MTNANIGIKGWRNYSSFSLFAAGSARADKNTAMLVDTASGNLSVVSTDWVLAGRIPCPVTRTYNHLDATSGVDRPFGPGWYWQYDMNLIGNMSGTGAVTWKAADGSEYDFTSPSGGGTEKTYTSPAGLHQYTLTYNATRTNEFELKAGKLTYAFKINSDDSRARLMYIRDAFGNGIELSRPVDGNSDPEATISNIQLRYYNGSTWTTHNIIQPTYSGGLITQLQLLDTEDSGDYIDLHYTYTTIDLADRLTKVEPKFGTTGLSMEVAYSYNSTATLGLQLTKLYDTEGYLAGTQWYWTVNYSSNQVSSVVFPVDAGTAGTVGYAYSDGGPAGWTTPPLSLPVPDSWTKVTDAESNNWYYGQNTDGTVKYTVDPLWNSSSHVAYTEYGYNTDHQVTEVWVPQPNAEKDRLLTKYYYNSHKNLAAVVDAYGFVSWYKYGSRDNYEQTGTGAGYMDVIGIFTVAPGQAAYADNDHTAGTTSPPAGLASPVNVDNFVLLNTSNIDHPFYYYTDGASNTIKLARTVIYYDYVTGTGQLKQLLSCSPENFGEVTGTPSHLDLSVYTLTAASACSCQVFGTIANGAPPSAAIEVTNGDLMRMYTPGQFKAQGAAGYTAYTHDETYGVVSSVEGADSVLASAGKTTNYTYNGLRTRVLTVTLPESVNGSQVTEYVYQTDTYLDHEYLKGTRRTDIGSWGVAPQVNINEYDDNGNLTKVWQADPGYTTTPRWDGNSAHGYNLVREAAYDRLNRAISSTVHVDWSQGTISPAPDPLVTETKYDANGNVTRVKGPEYTAIDSSTKYTYNFTDYDALGRVSKVYITTASTEGNLLAKPGTYTEYTYDLAGNVLEVRDPLYILDKPGYHKTQYTYDWLNRRIMTSRYSVNESMPVALSTGQHFDASGGVLWSMDGEGYKTYPQRDLSGRLVSVHRGKADGNGDLREYDADSHLESYYSYEDVASGETPLYRTRNAYDEMGRLVNSGREEYDSNTDTYINWNCNTADATFNYNGWALHSYDKVNAGKYTEREYDDWGQVTTVQAPAVPDPANPAVDVVYETSYIYDVLGRRLSGEDARGNATTYTYDVLGRQISVTNANNNTTQTFYDARSLRWKVIRPSGAETISLYDDARRLATQTVYHDSTSDTTAYQYSVLGQVLQVDYPGGGRETFNYDQLGRRVESGTLLTAAPEVVLTTSYIFDNNNRVVRMVAPGGYTYVSDYDDLGNLTSSTDPAHEVTSYTYDLDNRLLTKTDPVGVVATNTYDWKTGRVLSVQTELNATSADDITMSYSYDNNGRPTTITDGRGYSWAKAYDAMGRMVSLTTPNPGSGAYTHTIVYDGNGNIVKTTDFKSVSHYYAYDALNRMSGHGPSEYAYTETYTYACCGSRLSAYTDAFGTASLSYDQLGRLTSFTDSQGYNVAYTYDAMGRILTLTPDQGTNYRTEYTYQANGAVDTVTVYDNGTGAQTSYTYSTTSGKLSWRDFPVESGQNLRTTYSYDAAGRLQSETLQRYNSGSTPPAVTNLSRAVYAYAIARYQRRTTRTEQVYNKLWLDSWRMNYAWDGLSRQVSEARDDYGAGWAQVYAITQAYDKTGNRTAYSKSVAAGQEANYGVSESLSYTYTAVNALASIADSLDASYMCSVTGGAGGPGQTPRGTDCECVSCCRGWGVSYSSQLQTGPAPCGKACDYCHAGAGGSCQDQECACRGCLWDYYNSIGEFQPSRYEVMCEKCCCDGCPCGSGSGGGGGGCPGCGSGNGSPGRVDSLSRRPQGGGVWTGRTEVCAEMASNTLGTYKLNHGHCKCLLTKNILNCLERGMALLSGNQNRYLRLCHNMDTQFPGALPWFSPREYDTNCSSCGSRDVCANTNKFQERYRVYICCNNTGICNNHHYGSKQCDLTHSLLHEAVHLGGYALNDESCDTTFDNYDHFTKAAPGNPFWDYAQCICTGKLPNEK